MKKKNSKLIFAALSIGALAGGAYYFVKNVLNKDSEDDFDDFADFEDDFDDFDDFDDDTKNTPDGREYVTINLSETSKEEPIENMETQGMTEEAPTSEEESLTSEETNETATEETDENTTDETSTTTDEFNSEETFNNDDIEEIIL